MASSDASVPATPPYIDRATTHRPSAAGMSMLCSAIGVLSMGMTNKLRLKPIMFQPWLHAGLGLTGAFLGSRLGALYHDVGATKDRQAAAFTALPSWAYAQLSPEQLSAELRDQRLASLRVKFGELAAEEEAQLKALIAAGGGEHAAGGGGGGRAQLS